MEDVGDELGDRRVAQIQFGAVPRRAADAEVLCAREDPGETTSGGHRIPAVEEVRPVVDPSVWEALQDAFTALV